MAMNISCKFEKASYNIFFVRAVTVKSLYTLRRRWRRRNKVKSIVSTGCYPVDTIINIDLIVKGQVNTIGSEASPLFTHIPSFERSREIFSSYGV